MHDVAHKTNAQLDSGESIHLIGYFGTGGRDKTHNWLEVGEGFRGPLHVYAQTIQQTFLNHPMRFRPEQVHFHDELSLTAGKPATASQTAPGSSPTYAVDRDFRTLWEAPAGSYLQIDLGSEHTIDRFGIESAGLLMDRELNTVRAELHVSLDGKAFTRAAVLHTARFAWADTPVEPVPARYVRLHVTGPGADGTIRVVSFNVFGPP